MAGSIGGYNAHSANIVAAIFIATGQVQILCNLLFESFNSIVLVRYHFLHCIIICLQSGYDAQSVFCISKHQY